MSGDGPWWVVIDMDRPYTGGEVLEAGQVRIPFATGESARRAAEGIRVTVRRDPGGVITGAVIGQEAISAAPEAGLPAGGLAAERGQDAQKPRDHRNRSSRSLSRDGTG